MYEAEVAGRVAKANATPAPVTPSSESDEKLARLERLAMLHTSGSLSDEEFESLKAEALNGQ